MPPLDELRDELFWPAASLLAAAVVGLILGIAVVRTKPEWTKSYAKFSMNRAWPVYTFGVVMFAALSVANFRSGSWYFGGFTVLFTALELYCLVAYGFKRLTPEQEAAIDANQPDWRFWKRHSPEAVDHGDAGPE